MVANFFDSSLILRYFLVSLPSLTSSFHLSLPTSICIASYLHSRNSYFAETRHNNTSSFPSSYLRTLHCRAFHAPDPKLPSSISSLLHSSKFTLHLPGQTLHGYDNPFHQTIYNPCLVPLAHPRADVPLLYPLFRSLETPNKASSLAHPSSNLKSSISLNHFFPRSLLTELPSHPTRH